MTVAATIPETVEADILIEAPHTHRAWRASLPNGKKIIAFIEDGGPPLQLEPGTKIRGRLSVADFSRAEIVVGDALRRNGWQHARIGALTPP